MNDNHTQPFVRTAVSLSAMVFAAVGTLLLFAPDEVSGALFARPGDSALFQLVGAAMFGFASMSWIARGSLLGGIYGRAVVAGNQTHLTIGALILAKHGIVAGGSPAYWLLTGVYLAGALLFNYLFFFSSGIRGK